MLRTAVKGIAGTAITGTAALNVYVNTEDGKGFKRQVQFWSNIAPIVAEYYFYTSSDSPFVRCRKYLFYDNKDENGEKEYQKERRETLQRLHEKNSRKVLQILVGLKGLYIKLGQVLSVSTLPLPQIYKKYLRTLQSDVPGHEDYDTVIKSIIQEELGIANATTNDCEGGVGGGSVRNIHIDDVFEKIEKIPCGAASIGQAHRAKLKKAKLGDKQQMDDNDDFDVVIKVQYPQASWQVPADIQCIGQFLKICIWAEIVDETSAELSYEEFSRQFLSELDYLSEAENLQVIHDSSLDADAPYYKRNIIVPKLFKDLSTNKMITMEYIRGPKIEDEARRQLELLGIKTDRSVREIVKEAVDDVSKIENGEEIIVETKTSQGGEIDKEKQDMNNIDEISTKNRHEKTKSWKKTSVDILGKVIGVDAFLFLIRTLSRMSLLAQAATASFIQTVPVSIKPISWETWAEEHQSAAAQAARLKLTKEWIDALFDVHGHQIFTLGCFNADCHPGNILVVEDEKKKSGALGLIDFGQCKRLTPEEQVSVARLILSVANNAPDDDVANNFRRMGIKTKNDSTEFLAKFSRLLFGRFENQHMSHDWHMELHKMDKVMYFPKELSMVYRTSLLLRGLAMSMQINCSVGEQWKSHAQAVLDRHS